MNVLIPSAGTRCQLISYFMDKANGFDKVITTDCSSYSPAIYLSDSHYIVPRMTDPAYIPTLLDVCRKEEINLIVPLQEDELLLLAKHSDVFTSENILLSLSSPEAVNLCKDKYKLAKTLESLGIPTIKTYDYNSEAASIHVLPFPLICKERCGAGSVGVLKVENTKLLDAYCTTASAPMIVQPFKEAIEYGVDVYRDFVSHEIISVFIKKKLRMRSGETEKSVSVINEKIKSLVEKTVTELNLLGPLDFDIFEVDGEFFILEINPRFGGGYPHAYSCGINFIKFLANNCSKKINKPFNEYEPGKVLLKYTEAMLLDEKNMF